MNKRTSIVMLITSALIVAASGTASAKGPESATITSPGISEPSELLDNRNPDLVRELMRQTGLWSATGGGSRIPAQPGGDLGPVYTLTWINSGPPGEPVEDRTIRQLLYPHAEIGPVIHTPSQIGLEGWGPDVVGWSIAPDDLVDTLAALGVPVSAPQSSSDLTEHVRDAVAAPPKSDPVAASDSIRDTSAPNNPDAAKSVEGESTDDDGYLVVMGFGFVIMLIWLARCRTTDLSQ